MREMKIGIASGFSNLVHSACEWRKLLCVVATALRKTPRKWGEEELEEKNTIVINKKNILSPHKGRQLAIGQIILCFISWCVRFFVSFSRCVTFLHNYHCCECLFSSFERRHVGYCERNFVFVKAYREYYLFRHFKRKIYRTTFERWLRLHQTLPAIEKFGPISISRADCDNRLHLI